MGNQHGHQSSPPPPAPSNYHLPKEHHFNTHHRGSVPPTAMAGHRSLPVHPKKQRELGKEGLQLFNSALGHSNNNKRGSVLPALPPRNNVKAKTKTNRTSDGPKVPRSQRPTQRTVHSMKKRGVKAKKIRAKSRS